MLLVDYRKGSRELLQPLTDAGLTCLKTTLDFADVAFEGRGEGDTIVDVGVELKCLPDAVSSLRTGRLAGHQMPGLVSLYDRNVWIVVEGHWSTNKAGIIVQAHWRKQGGRPKLEWIPVKGKMTGAELEKRLLTLELQYGCHVRFTTDRRATVSFLVSLFRWWTDRSLDEHRSHLTVHVPSTVVPISDERAALMRWPGVGVEWSRAALTTFGSINRAATASIAEWAALTATTRQGQSRRFGTASAEKVVAFLKGDT